MKIRIKALKQAIHEDLIKEYENPIIHACMINVGDEFISIDGKKPDGFCESAWETISPFVKRLNNGEDNFYDGWMKNKKSVMLSCNDGFRPVSFYVEVIE